jgi:pilus assembly protein CpaB
LTFACSNPLRISDRASRELLMKTTRILILGVAVAAGIGAAIMVAGSRQPPEIRRTVVHAPIATDEVLVASKDLTVGTVIESGDLRWQNWPKTDLPQNVVRRRSMPSALVEFDRALVRYPLSAGEPIYPDRLIKSGTAGFMAAILPSGMRAVAINIDQQGSQTAGGFILPNDHVDVIHTYQDQQAAKSGVPNPMVTETLLRNVRVLAIGQNIQERNNEKVVVGANATLELTPDQVVTLVLAQRTGQLSLALRSLADNKTSQSGPLPSKGSPPSDMTIVRYGIPVQTRPN